MIRVMATDVVNAYKATGLIPIRRAWESMDGRGGCAIDALARHWTDLSGQSWAERLDEDYVHGFTAAWDCEETRTYELSDSDPRAFKIGFWDGVLCRNAVEQEFSSITAVHPPQQNKNS